MNAEVSEKKSFKWTYKSLSTYTVNGMTDGRIDGRAENRTHISHPAKAAVTINKKNSNKKNDNLLLSL